MPKNMSLAKGLLALIGIHLVGVLLVLGFVLGASWLGARLTGLVWSETAVLLLACLIFAIVLQKIFGAGFGGMLVLLVLSILLAFGGGWLLTLWLPFSLSYTGPLLLGSAFAFIYYFFADLKDVKEELEEEGWFDEDDDLDAMPIPQSRFIRDEAEQTGETLFRYIIANAIYLRMAETPDVKGSMASTEVQELSIRLADAAIGVLKRKSPRTKRYQVTVSALRGAFDKMGQQPYDVDILEVAVLAVNTQLLLDEDLEEIIRDRRWSMRYGH